MRFILAAVATLSVPSLACAGPKLGPPALDNALAPVKECGTASPDNDAQGCHFVALTPTSKRVTLTDSELANGYVKPLSKTARTVTGVASTLTALGAAAAAGCGRGYRYCGSDVSFPGLSNSRASSNRLP